MNGRRLPVAVGLAVVGGLLLVGATSGTWLVDERVREVGGVELADPHSTPGVDLAPQAVAVGVAAALSSLGLVIARGRGRRVLGAFIAGLGAVGAAVVAAGIAAGADAGGTLTAAPWFALTGALAVVAAGAVAWRRPAPPPVLGPRYSLDDDEVDSGAEWEIGSDENS